MDTIIFDVDGTLSDVSHRRHLVTGGCKDWDRFTDEMVNDPPHRDVCLLAELLGDHPLVNQGAIKLFIFSGRPDSHREQTEDWLAEFARPLLKKAEGIYMRAAGDYRSDDIIKEEFLDALIAKGYEPRFVVDDRPSVCAMWKRRGITLLRHDNGEWDHAFDGPLGTLHMMVGPSGAGKSTFIEQHFMGEGLHPSMKEDFAFPRSAIISSDALRQEFTGDFRDQSMNDAVFNAFHNLIKARLDSGLNVIADATHLRAADRRAVRNLAAPEQDIHYWVVDRPIKNKLETAGWRAEVKIKGTSLIEKHHQSFQSGRKLILAGDDDPRVTVHDYRRY